MDMRRQRRTRARPFPFAAVQCREHGLGEKVKIMPNKKTKPKRTAYFFGRLLTKLTIAYSLIIVGVIVLLNTYPLFSTQSAIVTSKQQDMLKNANIISSALSQLETLDQNNVKSIMDVLGVIGYRVYVLDHEQTILYDSMYISGVGVPFGEDEGVLRAFGGHDYSLTVYKDKVFASYAVAPVILTASPDAPMGAIYLNDYDDERGGILASMQSLLQNLSIMIVVFIALISVGMSIRIGKRFNALINAIYAVREGNYGHRVRVRGNDELAVIASEFDQLSSRLQKTEEMRRQFVADASHELKTPLASMRLMADTILNTDSMPVDSVRDFVGDIAQETERLSRISDHLLTLTRLDYSFAVIDQKVDATATIGKAVKMLAPLAQKQNVDIKCETAPDVIILGGYDHLYQIAVNLIENAIKYNVSGGSVKVFLYRQGRDVTLIVDDTGVGIPDKDLPKVFDRFYRVDKARSRETGGTGLGLSIVKQAVTACGGSVKAEKSPAGGARFVVTLRAGD